MKKKELTTECSKCGANMPEPPKAKGWLANFPMKITAYRCGVCDHWNDLARRKYYKTQIKVK